MARTRRKSREKSRGQSAFEFLLLIGGGVLFVILAVAVVRTALVTNQNAANNTAGGYQNFVGLRGDSALYHDAVKASCAAGWSFGEGSGTTAADASGNGNTGTLTNGPTWTAGISGNAIQLDGTNDYVNVPDTGTTSLDVTNGATVAAWIKITAYPVGQYFMIVNKESVYETGLYDTTGAFWGAAAPGCWRVAGTHSISLNTWNYVVIVWTGSYQYHYVNGTLVETFTGCSTPISTNDNDLRIGARGADGAPAIFFNGTIDEVAVYNRALTPDEISGLYRAKTTWCS